MSLFTTLKFILTHPLNQGQPGRALTRFAAWQLRSRLATGPVVHHWLAPAKFLARAGETGLTGNIYTGLHEFPEMGFVLHFLRPTDLFVDVGANVGSYTLLACAAVGARGIAFEPVPETYRRLQANMALNHLTCVHCINQAVGAQAGQLQFTRDRDTTNHVLAVDEWGAATLTVPITTLDIALANEMPILLKIDVEGYETPVLEGGLQTLAQPGLLALILELNGSGQRYGFDEAKILAKLIAHGFQPYHYQPLQRELVPLQGKNLNSGNTLFLRNLALVQARLASAPRWQLHGHDF